MTLTFQAVAHSGEPVDNEYVVNAARQAGGVGGTLYDGTVRGWGFAALKNAEQFCARMHLKYPDLQFEISGPSKKKQK